MDRDLVPQLTCPNCQAPMRPVHTIPKIGQHPELVTFRCGQCRHVETIEHRAD